MPRLARITVYPIKSLPGVTLNSVRVLRSGALEHDRRWALCDAAGKFVNAKRTAAIHRIRAKFDDYLEGTLHRVTLAADGGPAQATIDLESDLEVAEAWFSTLFGFAVKLVENPVAGYPDDTESPGPTIVATSTLRAVADWFPDLTLEETRARFRANLEVAESAADAVAAGDASLTECGNTDLPAFWEDQLYGPADRSVRFRIGSVTFEGVNPCQRCVVPTRDSQSGAVIEQFAKLFGQRRQETLPAWAEASRFNHFYRLTVNCRPPADHQPGTLTVGDSVEIEA
jgi:uncharacterized protein YcbX